MGLLALYDAGGNPLKDANGNQIYVEVSGPDPKRIYKVPAEKRVGKVPEGR